MYESWHTPSWDMEFAAKHSYDKEYECDYCGCRLKDHEVFLSGGKMYCGCCK